MFYFLNFILTILLYHFNIFPSRALGPVRASNGSINNKTPGIFPGGILYFVFLRPLFAYNPD